MIDENMDRAPFLTRARSTIVAGIFVLAMGAAYRFGFHYTGLCGLIVSTLLFAGECDRQRAKRDTIPIVDMKDLG